MSFFKKIDSSIPMNKQDQKIENPIIYSDPNPELYFITDSMNKRQVSFIQNALQKIYKHDIPSFALIYSFVFKPKDNDLTKNITKFMYKYSIDYKKYIPDHSKIICIGRSIYSLTMETSFNASAFYPYDYVDTYFYYPNTKSYVFPVDDFFQFASFEEKRFLDNFYSFFFFKQIERAYSFKIEKLRLPRLNTEIVENPNEFLLEKTDKVKEVAWDLETDGLLFFKNKIVCITMSFDGITGYYMDFSKIDLDILNNFLKDKYQIGANLKFDCKFLRDLGISNARVDFDTLSAGHCLNETASNSLSAHGWMYTYYGGHEIELQKYKASHPKLINYSMIPRSILSVYASMDSCIAFQVYKKQLEKLSLDPQLYSYYFKEVVPNLNLFIDIEYRGVPIDWNLLEELRIEKEKELKIMEKEIMKMINTPVNLASPKDLGRVLEEELRFPDLGLRSKEGYYLSNEEALTQWKKLGYPVAEKLVDYRSLSTQINTFIGKKEENSAYWEYRNPKTDYIHPTYSVMLAQSHRNKCKDPNLQQVPKKTDFSKGYRKIFIVPEKGKYFSSEGDYAAFQMRIAAVLSGDQNLKDAFTKYGGDVHSMTAIAIFHTDWTIEQFMAVKKQKPYKTERDISKGVNFGFLFGGSAWSFANDKLKAEWDLDTCIEFLKSMKLDIFAEDPYLEAAEYIRNSFFKKYPKLVDWHEQCHTIAKETGMIRSPFGARRLLPRLTYIGKDTDRKEISEDQNISKNSPVQNFEAVSIMRGMREFNELAKKNNWKSRIFGMIHDAVEFYIYKEERPFIVKVILDIFQKMYDEYDGVNMSFELELADPEIGEVWGFGKEVEE